MRTRGGSRRRCGRAPAAPSYSRRRSSRRSARRCRPGCGAELRRRSPRPAWPGRPRGSRRRARPAVAHTARRRIGRGSRRPPPGRRCSRSGTAYAECGSETSSQLEPPSSRTCRFTPLEGGRDAGVEVGGEVLARQTRCGLRGDPPSAGGTPIGGAVQRRGVERIGAAHRAQAPAPRRSPSDRTPRCNRATSRTRRGRSGSRGRSSA